MLIQNMPKTVRCFERYVEVFFTRPGLIRIESGHKRAWICDAMRRFEEYYDRKFHSPELKLPQFRFQELLGVLALKRGQNAIISL